MDWVAIICFFLAFEIGESFGYKKGLKKGRNEVKLSNTWECPYDCGLSFSSSNWQILTMLGEGHLEDRHGISSA